MPPRVLISSAVLLSALACAESPKVEIRNSEVWLLSDGKSLQLTRDGLPKSQALLSPAGGSVAYYQTCPKDPHRIRCLPTIVVINRTGSRVSAFRPGRGQLTDPSCDNLSILGWIGDRIIASQCHINPSLEEYFESDISSGRTTRDLLGYDFTPSPDRKRIAHVGWIVHFAPPYAHSNYLQLDNTTVYPLPSGTKPLPGKNGDPPPEVVHHEGASYLGIHEFHSEFFWAPDSRHVAFIDCIYNWTSDRPAALSVADGQESHRRCSAVIVSPTGSFDQLPLTVSPGLVRLSWISARELSVQTGSAAQTIRLR